jgi:hypothetical protein
MIAVIRPSLAHRQCATLKKHPWPHQWMVGTTRKRTFARADHQLMPARRAASSRLSINPFAATS